MDGGSDSVSVEDSGREGVEVLRSRLLLLLLLSCAVRVSPTVCAQARVTEADTDGSRYESGGFHGVF